ncbi:hypothetical protein KW805_04510 [Candidatus Pacearchaeota archaeon]|nr:hypothetical protein [Candidatus Pacearchaeota archaeon]
MIIIPTVFAKSKKEFDERFNKVKTLSRKFQVDIMDGKFVKAKSINISAIPRLNNYESEAHLMVRNPLSYIRKLRHKGFKKIIFHYESQKNAGAIEDLIAAIHTYKMKAFIALNPETKVQNLLHFISLIDGVLLMGVHPGKEHQHLLPSIYTKIKQLKKLAKISIQIDGGVNPLTAKKLKRAGATILNSGSFISDSENPKEALKKLT